MLGTYLIKEVSSPNFVEPYLINLTIWYLCKVQKIDFSNIHLEDNSQGKWSRSSYRSPISNSKRLENQVNIALLGNFPPLLRPPYGVRFYFVLKNVKIIHYPQRIILNAKKNQCLALCEKQITKLFKQGWRQNKCWRKKFEQETSYLINNYQTSGSVHGVTVIVVWKRLSNQSSKPEWGCLHFS